jgi:hypothetical protein
MEKEVDCGACCDRHFGCFVYYFKESIQRIHQKSQSLELVQTGRHTRL